jgi:hypothetical protein
MREKPPSPRALQGTDRVAFSPPRHSSLRSLAEQRSMRGPRHPIWMHYGLFVLEETVRWVRASTPAECSPRGLGGMSYPFKALNQASGSA